MYYILKNKEHYLLLYRGSKYGVDIICGGSIIGYYHGDSVDTMLLKFFASAERMFEEWYEAFDEDYVYFGDWISLSPIYIAPDLDRTDRDLVHQYVCEHEGLDNCHIIARGDMEELLGKI